MFEKWKDIKGYESLYQISSFGRIKSVSHSWVGFGKEIVCTTKEKILSRKTNKAGYEQVVLYKGNESKTFLVHRLVAEVFIPNPNNFPCVNHKNEIKTDNRAENLEWCTYSYNNNYGSRINKTISKTKNGVLSKPVIQYSLDGIFVAEYPSTAEIKRQYGFNCGNISSCCNGKQKTAYGFKWKYKEVA